jgi:hypothetical protein
MLLGSALTLAIQWYRRHKQLRYMDAVSAKCTVYTICNCCVLQLPSLASVKHRHHHSTHSVYASVASIGASHASKSSLQYRDCLAANTCQHHELTASVLFCLLQAPLSSEYRAAGPLHQPAAAATALQMSSAAPLKPRLPAAPGAQPKYYSPLTKSMSFAAAGLHSQASHGGSRLTEAGADTNGRGLQDQVGMAANERCS